MPEHMPNAKVVLVVEDNVELRELLADLLGGAGCEVLQAGSLREAQAWVDQRADITVLLTDNVLDGEAVGAVLVDYARHQIDAIDCTVITGDIAQLLDSDVEFRILQKPASMRQILAVVASAEP